MDREIVFCAEAFVAFFGAFFGWTGYVAKRANDTPKDVMPWEKARGVVEVVGVIDPDHAGANLPVGEADEYVRRQVEAGTC